jgi:hypothetical protein
MFDPVNLGVLFPLLQRLSKDSGTDEASNLVKQNPIVDNVASLSELVDAFWWCVYGYVFITKNEDYISDERMLLDDMRCLIKCERLRMSNNKHRYPTTHPKRRGRKANEKQENRLKMYANLLERTARTLDSLDEDDSRQLEWLDMLTNIRNKQECLLGYDWENVRGLRESQYNNIAKLLDSIFIHRKFVTRNQEEGGELLTPEEANEWDDAKNTIEIVCGEDSTPGFIRNLVKMKSVMIED